jgi:hypothetical protein
MIESDVIASKIWSMLDERDQANAGLGIFPLWVSQVTARIAESALPISFRVQLNLMHYSQGLKKPTPSRKLTQDVAEMVSTYAKQAGRLA